MAVDALDNVTVDPVDGRAPLILGRDDFAQITDDVVRPILEGPPKVWWAVFTFALTLLGLLGACIGYLLWKGTGIWGLNNPVGWGWAIINFVFWVGIGHAGTLISAILFLFRAKWRNAINRSAEAMTVIAVLTAAQFLGIHVGRMWKSYFILPYPNQRACSSA